MLRTLLGIVIGGSLALTFPNEAGAAFSWLRSYYKQEVHPRLCQAKAGGEVLNSSAALDNANTAMFPLPNRTLIL